MNTARRMRLWSLIVEHAHNETVELRHVCAAVISAAGVDSVAIAVAAPPDLRETVYASDSIASELEELALTLGEGPSVDAFTGGLVLVANLEVPQCLARWPIFVPAAAQFQVRATFALPLQIGGIRLGVLDLYRAKPGALSREQLADVLGLADTACGFLLDGAGRDPVRPYKPEPASGHHPQVHQATGMIIVQLGVTAVVALSRLRAYAYVHDRRLRDVARDVVARRLRFEPEAQANNNSDGKGE